MTKPAWGRPRCRPTEAVVDPAPHVLSAVATRIAAHASDVFRRSVIATHDAPLRGSWAIARDADAQTWHSDVGDGIDVWCSIDGEAARILLEMVLGGPAAPKPTALERRIIREAVDRLLTAGGRLWEERCSPHLSSGAGWVCPILISDAGAITTHLDLYSPAMAESATPIPALVDVREVPVTLCAVLPPRGVPVGAIAAWREGTVVTVAGRADATVDLYAGAARIAAGRLGSLRGRRALRIEVVDVDAAR